MTEPKAIYETVITIHSSEARDELDRTVLRILQRHVGKAARIEREFLVEEVYGYVRPENKPVTYSDGYGNTGMDNGYGGLPNFVPSISSSVADRRVRESIERLRERYVILSSSGCGGYWLPDSQEEAQEFIREMENRARKELHTVSQMRKLLWKQFSGQVDLEETK
jgi:hypothetical protein